MSIGDDDKVLPFKRPAPEPDADCVWTDEHGVQWFKFLCEYGFDGSSWSVEVWARSREDAQARLGSIGCTGVVKGQLYTVIAAGNVTTEDLLRCGAEIAQPEERPICNGEDAGSTPALGTNDEWLAGMNAACDEILTSLLGVVQPSRTMMTFVVDGARRKLARQGDR